MKKKILVLIQGLNGCSLHRLILPYQTCQYLTDDLDIQVGLGKVKDIEELIGKILEFDVLIYHNSLPSGVLSELKGKVKTVLDIDDYWVLSSEHPLYGLYLEKNITETVKYHIINSDYITTTTKLLADKVKELNQNVYIFPNALIPKGQFKPVERNNKRVNISLIGGSSHTADIALLDGLIQQMPKDLLDKVRFQLKGFDEGTTSLVDKDGKTVKTIQTAWWNNQWTKWEMMLTNNYKIVSDEHKKSLWKFDKLIEYNDPDEPYKRSWTLPIDKYAHHYDDTDILLVPLKSNNFSKYKSCLKFIEASVKGVAVIASNVSPYKEVGINLFDKGGNINKEGNCILVNENRGIKGWIKAIKKLVESKELREMTINNLKKLTDEEFNLVKVCKDRLKFLKEILYDKK